MVGHSWMALTWLWKRLSQHERTERGGTMFEKEKPPGTCLHLEHPRLHTCEKWVSVAWSSLVCGICSYYPQWTKTFHLSIYLPTCQSAYHLSILWTLFIKRKTSHHFLLCPFCTSSNFIHKILFPPPRNNLLLFSLDHFQIFCSKFSF